MDTVIRSCQARDAAALSLVGQATFLETYSGVLPVADIVSHCQTQHGLPYYQSALAKPRNRLWLAEVAPGQAPVGFAMMCPPDLPVATTGTDVELRRIYLLHRFHGSRLGARLMEAALDWARSQGFARVLLGVYGGNARAIAFYTHQGYARVGVRQFQVGAALYDDLVLAKAL